MSTFSINITIVVSTVVAATSSKPKILTVQLFYTPKIDRRTDVNGQLNGNHSGLDGWRLRVRGGGGRSMKPPAFVDATSQSKHELLLTQFP